MRCATCGYSLWNIAARECPECGARFRPSDYEFVPGTVQFCCPHCRHARIGETACGHPATPAFTCAGCGAAVDMDHMIVLPVEGLGHAETRAGVAPWLERRQRGGARAFFATIGLALVRPGTLMRGVPRQAPVGESVAFGFAASALALIVGGALPYLGWWAWLSVRARSWGVDWQVFWMLMLVVIGLFGLAGAIPLLALSTHTVLRMIARPQHALDRTVHAIGYSAGACAASAVPCAGPFVGWIWWLVSAVFMVRAGQGVSGGRASVAVLALPVSIVLVVGGVAALGRWAVSNMMGGAGMGFSPQNQQTFFLNNSLIQYAWQNNRTGPAHALELLVGNPGGWGWAGGTGSASPFCHPDSRTKPADISVNGATLEDFLAMTTSERLSAVASVLDTLPQGIVAHRVGDYVFTYHDATLGPGDPNLWLLVMLPDPDVNGVPAPGDPVHLGTGNYSVTEITFAELPAALETQNDYRATLGLPPLPDLTTVRHGRPALAPPASAVGNSQDNPGPPTD